MNKRIKQMRKKLKERKGSIFIEYTIGLLMLVVFVAFCVDILLIGHKHYYIGEEMGNISRTLSVQSGAEMMTPTGYPGGDEAYQTSGEILSRMELIAEAAGFERSEWDLYVVETNQDGDVVRSGKLSETSDFKADYLNRISVQFSGTFDWAILSSAVPSVGTDKLLEIERISMAEYLRNYD